jgi:hypothetical protein
MSKLATAAAFAFLALDSTEASRLRAQASARVVAKAEAEASLTLGKQMKASLSSAIFVAQMKEKYDCSSTSLDLGERLIEIAKKNREGAAKMEDDCDNTLIRIRADRKKTGATYEADISQEMCVRDASNAVTGGMIKEQCEARDKRLADNVKARDDTYAEHKKLVEDATTKFHDASAKESNAQKELETAITQRDELQATHDAALSDKNREDQVAKETYEASIQKSQYEYTTIETDATNKNEREQAGYDETKTSMDATCTRNYDHETTLLGQDSDALESIRGPLQALAESSCLDAFLQTSAAEVKQSAAFLQMNAAQQAACAATMAKLELGTMSTSFLERAAAKSKADPHAFSNSYESWGEHVKQAKQQAEDDKTACLKASQDQHDSNSDRSELNKKNKIGAAKVDQDTADATALKIRTETEKKWKDAYDATVGPLNEAKNDVEDPKTGKQRVFNDLHEARSAAETDLSEKVAGRQAAEAAADIRKTEQDEDAEEVLKTQFKNAKAMITDTRDSEYEMQNERSLYSRKQCAADRVEFKEEKDTILQILAEIKGRMDATHRTDAYFMTSEYKQGHSEAEQKEAIKKQHELNTYGAHLQWEITKALHGNPELWFGPHCNAYDYSKSWTDNAKTNYCKCWLLEEEDLTHDPNFKHEYKTAPDTGSAQDRCTKLCNADGGADLEGKGTASEPNEYESAEMCMKNQPADTDKIKAHEEFVAAGRDESNR